MEIKIIDFIETQRENSKLIGKLLVSVSSKVRIWFTVLKDKHNKPFCLPVSINIEGKYFAAFVLSDASKAQNQLGWKPRITFKDMVSEMVQTDLEEARRDTMVKKAGFRVYDFQE